MYNIVLLRRRLSHCSKMFCTQLPCPFLSCIWLKGATTGRTWLTRRLCHARRGGTASFFRRPLWPDPLNRVRGLVGSVTAVDGVCSLRNTMQWIFQLIKLVQDMSSISSRCDAKLMHSNKSCRAEQCLTRIQRYLVPVSAGVLDNLSIFMVSSFPSD